jgi:oligopeptide/dipeptide ABC transporter ATP-binding protein
LSTKAMRRLRGDRVSVVFQDPMTALNPVLPIGRQMIDIQYRCSGGTKAKRARAVHMLDRVRIPDSKRRLAQYPHEFSGGMRQRATIAMAVAGTPKVLIADEPTTALDVTVQAQIVSLIADLLQQTGMGVVWVTHDLALLARIADRVMVMFAGRVMESATCVDLFARPQHPYTQALLATLRQTEPGASGAGAPASTAEPAAQGCPFATRCTWVMDVCRSALPTLGAAAHGGRVACWKAAP